MATGGSISLTQAIVGHELIDWKPTRPVMSLAGVLWIDDIAVRGRLREADDGLDVVRSTTRAAFDQFVELGPAAYGLFDSSFGRSGIAQMKILAPTPGARLVGGFIDTTTFVGLRLYWRHELPFKPTHQPGIISYKTLVEEVTAHWDRILPGVRRVPMKEFDE